MTNETNFAPRGAALFTATFRAATQRTLLIYVAAHLTLTQRYAPSCIATQLTFRKEQSC